MKKNVPKIAMASSDLTAAKRQAVSFPCEMTGVQVESIFRLFNAELGKSN